MDILEKIKKLQTPLKKLAVPLIMVSVIIGVIIFFISYSLARHKKMVHQLRVQILKLQTENKIAELEKKKAIVQLKLTQLKKDDAQHEVKRKEIRDEIQKIDVQEKKAQEVLVQRRKGLDKDNLDDLLVKANQLVKDTL